MEVVRASPAFTDLTDAHFIYLIRRKVLRCRIYPGVVEIIKSIGIDFLSGR